MKKQAGHRKYNFPDADLYLQAMERIKYAHRDITYFEQYSYDIERLKKFKAMCDKFRALPDDDEMVGDQMVLTEKKVAANWPTKGATPRTLIYEQREM